MKKALLLMAWMAESASLLPAQTVNLFDESSLSTGDSINCEKYQVVYDTKFIYETKVVNHSNLSTGNITKTLSAISCRTRSMLKP